jgi:NAD-dependent SIR2 family protein deacetylase
MEIARPAPERPLGIDGLADFVRRHPRLFVLTGAGCSTASGIPDYRDESGAWKHKPPVAFAEFVQSAETRRRYWARSLLGFGRVARAEPGAAHRALARLEALGHVATLVTQNVDGLHQRAGSRRVLDLHGRLDRVCCLGCGASLPRGDVQRLLEAWNPDYATLGARAAPDGDAALERASYADVRVPDCPECGGVLKPAVVFFGEGVPRARVAAAYAALASADAVLVVGSSLMVYSGYRFCLAAAERGLPIVALNRGRTRADALVALKLEGECGETLEALIAALGAPAGLDGAAGASARGATLTRP